MWEINLWPDVETWLLDLHDADYVRVAAAIDLFAFDPGRSAILLVAGDKAGAWDEWYRDMIPIADNRLDQWLEQWDGTGDD